MSQRGFSPHWFCSCNFASLHAGIMRSHLKMHNREMPNATSVIIYSLEHKCWGHIWKCIVEKSQIIVTWCVTPTPPHANLNMLLQIFFGFDYFLAFVTLETFSFWAGVEKSPQIRMQKVPLQKQMIFMAGGPRSWSECAILWPIKDVTKYLVPKTIMKWSLPRVARQMLL